MNCPSKRLCNNRNRNEMFVFSPQMVARYLRAWAYRFSRIQKRNGSRAMKSSEELTSWSSSPQTIAGRANNKSSVFSISATAETVQRRITTWSNAEECMAVLRSAFSLLWYGSAILCVLGANLRKMKGLLLVFTKLPLTLSRSYFW